MTPVFMEMYYESSHMTASDFSTTQHQSILNCLNGWVPDLNHCPYGCFRFVFGWDLEYLTLLGQLILLTSAFLSVLGNKFPAPP